MFGKQKKEIEAVARSLHASQLRSHRAKQFIVARANGLVRNPLTMLLPFTIGMLTGARQLKTAPDQAPSLPVPSISKLNHLLTIYSTINDLKSRKKQPPTPNSASTVTQSPTPTPVKDAH